MALPGIALAAAAATFATTACAADVPKLDLSKTCRPIAGDVTLQIDSERCFKSEQAARDELKKEWASFPAANRGLCTQTATMGGMPSYVALITCLEMKRDAAKLPADTTLRTQPAGLSTKKK
jgi:hypothetical protein